MSLYYNGQRLIMVIILAWPGHVAVIVFNYLFSDGGIKRLFNYVLLSVKEQTLKLQRKIGKQFVTRENISGYCGCGPLLCPRRGWRQHIIQWKHRKLGYNWAWLQATKINVSPPASSNNPSPPGLIHGSVTRLINTSQPPPAETWSGHKNSLLILDLMCYIKENWVVSGPGAYKSLLNANKPNRKTFLRIYVWIKSKIDANLHFICLTVFVACCC